MPSLQDSHSTPSTKLLQLSVCKKASSSFVARNFVVCSFVLSAAVREGEMPSYAKDLLQWPLGQFGVNAEGMAKDV